MIAFLRLSHLLRFAAVPSLAIAAALLCATCTPAVTIDMVTVGNPGNASDTTGYGAVNYEYRIGKYEVTIAQYAAFLNAVAKSDDFGLYSPTMGSSSTISGISRSGSSGSYVYAIVGPSGNVQSPSATAGDRPISIVSWFNAARFANWMSNGQPTGLQTIATTEDGAYTISGTTTAPARNTINPNTNAVPTFWIPTENEWYKAAYYKGGGLTSGYWAYATQSDSAPGNIVGDLINQANWRGGNLYAITQSSTLDVNQNYLLDVGAFARSVSGYGTFDQAGNVSEWNDLDGAAGSNRGVRGGSWTDGGAINISASFRQTFAPSYDRATGFRLASPVAVPEPSTCAMALAGLACGGYSMWRRQKRA